MIVSVGLDIFGDFKADPIYIDVYRDVKYLYKFTILSYYCGLLSFFRGTSIDCFNLYRK